MIERRAHLLRRVLYKLWIVPVVLFVLQFVVWGVEREPPIKFGEYAATPAVPGGPVILSIAVKRDLSRRCRADIVRQFFDSAGTRFGIGLGTQSYNARTMASNEARTPGKLILGFNIPAAAARGTGFLVTTANFTCNPLHGFWPIETTMTQEVEVL